jgi:mRNA interferase YafQ
MAKFIVKPTGPFRKDLKLAKRRNLPLSDLYKVVELLENGEPLPANLHNHLLTGDYKGYWECHVNPDWLLLYEKDTEIRIISLYRTGTHVDIFGKGKKR